ncbi:MAG: hypothetical protein M1840_006000 [Geoglossum simile]|nr:MAG: hypothetical protein M1840_006000 [Geoglossum simile]
MVPPAHGLPKRANSGTGWIAHSLLHSGAMVFVSMYLKEFLGSKLKPHGSYSAGSGKTVLTASVVDELFCRNPTNRPFVRFFFCRYDQPESLKAKTILGSLIKQCLDIDSMSSQLEAELGQLLESSPPDFEDLNELMESVLSVSKDQFIVIDAIDECEKAERNLFLSALRRFIDSPKATLKIFLTSGLHIGVELERALEPNYRMSMASPHTHSDIKTYIESSIAEKLENGELVVGQPQLIIEVRDALVGGAQGMFLWATFQIQDICDQGCDRDIRKAIGNLPKDLPETYERALTKIDSARTAQVVQKIFRWVAAAKRPLSLEELREAIAIQPGQPSLQSEALENETSRLIPYCGNLIVFDEEDQAVQFAHHTIKQFLLTESRNPSLDGFHFGLPRANYDIGEVCVTYLNFSDFQRQLAKISHMQARLSNPAAMLKTSLSAGLNLSTRSYWLRWVQLGASRNAGEIDVERQLYDAAGVKDPGPFEKLQAAYALFPYASEYWIYHSSDFSERYTGTWRLWSNLLLTENSFAHMPWAFDEWTRRTQSVIQWIIQNDHCALLRHIESSDMNSLSWRDRRRLLIDSAAQGRSQIVSVLISSGRIPKTDLGVALQAAAGEGHLDVVEWLLEAEANVNAAAAPAAGRSGQTASQVRSRLGVIGGVLVASGYNGRTALQAAAGSGHFDVVERLLWANADVNAAAAEHDGRTALQAAAGGGHVVVVERLLAAGANVNGAPGFNHGRTALQAAAEEGHLEIVKRLLAMNAHANAAAGGGFDGRTALQAAAGEGHLKVVEILLAVGANANAAAAGYDGRTALQAAAGGGHVEVAKRLLAAGASVNAPGSAGSGSRTALQAASGGGYLDVVEMLLEAKAEVNADPVGFDGRTALQAAAEGGHLDVVERLLAAKADVDASGGGYDCPTALQAAAGGGNLEVFERLLAAKTNVNAATSYDGQAALRVAARGGHLDVVEKLVVMGATDNAIGFDGPTALEAAALGGHLKVVERLLARKTDAIAATDGNRKAMRAAAEGGHLDVVEMLLVAKVDVNGNAGGAALQAAAKGGHLDVVKRLLAANADVNVAGRDGQTALQAAAEGGHLEVVERLLAAKAKDSATDTVDPLVARMALQAAAEGGHLDVVERLLVAKADVSNERGLAALHAAAREGHLDVVDRLLEAKADVNATVNTYINRTVLRAAAWGGHLHVVERLLAAKADVSNDKGRAALDAAVGGGHGEVVERLKLAGAKW